jgi:Mg2+/Co2+ transporter CorB
MDNSTGSTSSSFGGSSSRENHFEFELFGWIVPPIVLYILIPVLVVLAWIFTGMRHGLLRYDRAELDKEIELGSKSNQHYAQSLYPLRRNGNVLLCVVIVTSTLASSILSILLVDLTSVMSGFLISTSLLFVLGKLLSQALFSQWTLGTYPPNEQNRFEFLISHRSYQLLRQSGCLGSLLSFLLLCLANR